MELGETFEETAVREVYEETGLKVKNLKLFSTFSGEELHHIYPNGDEVYAAICIFITKDYSGEIKADARESSDVGFFNPNEISGEIHPPDRIILKEYLKYAAD